MLNTPLPGRILAVDYGRRHLGLALSDEGQRVAQIESPRLVNNKSQSLNILEQYVKHQDIKAILIGIPLGLHNKPTQMSQEIKEFIAQVEAATTLPVIAWNETGTSKMAEQNYRGKASKNSHSEAARIMLQEYLDFKASGI